MKSSKPVTALGGVLLLLGLLGALVYSQTGKGNPAVARECVLNNAAGAYAEYLENGGSSPDGPSSTERACAEYESEPKKGGVYAAWAALAGLGLLIATLGQLASNREHPPATSPVSNAEALDAEDMRICPYCAEEIRAAAVKCKHCQSTVSPATD